MIELSHSSSLVGKGEERVGGAVEKKAGKLLLPVFALSGLPSYIHFHGQHLPSPLSCVFLSFSPHPKQIPDARQWSKAYPYTLLPGFSHVFADGLPAKGTEWGKFSGRKPHGSCRHFQQGDQLKWTCISLQGKLCASFPMTWVAILNFPGSNPH